MSERFVTNSNSNHQIDLTGFDRPAARILPRLTSQHYFVVLLEVSVLALVCSSKVVADWPMYRADTARSARTDEPLGEDLAVHWVYQAATPQPAWPRSPRMQFDHVNRTVIANGHVVFGCSVTGQVTCLNLNTGTVEWQRLTDGPIRFAPAIWKDRVFVASDDGHLYALGLKDGELLGKLQGGPTDESVLGNQAMISKWPARGGPVIVDDVVFFAAGIWPSEGIYVYAIDAKTGRQLWCNSETGSMYMPQPHPTAEAASGISAQGHLIAAGTRLLIPTGRAVPAVLDRNTGEFQYFHLQKYGHYGEASTLATNGHFLNSGLVFDATTGLSTQKIGGGKYACTEKGVVRASNGTFTSYLWKQVEKVDRKGKKENVEQLVADWKTDTLRSVHSVITAGSKAVVGGDSQVGLVALDQAQSIKTLSVAGAAHGLAVSDGRLIVSTDSGGIYCFGPVKSRSTESPSKPGIASDKPRISMPKAITECAKEILQRSGVTQGYCLDLGCGDGQLALALASCSKMRVVAVDSDPENVRLARQRMLDAGVYGSKVTVLCRDETHTEFPRYFADLIVSGKSADPGANGFAMDEAKRLQRPFGGTICVGRSGEMTVARRGTLEGAGKWTHQYADVGNTVCSGDQLVKGELGMLWFRDVDFDLPSRHGRAPAPLFDQGRLFHEGINGLVAVNAYNGTELWRYEIPDVLKAYNGDELMGTAGTGSNFCLGNHCVFVRDGDWCRQLNAADGKLVREFRTPADGNGARKPWGFVACAGKLLIGSEANDEHIVTYRYLNRGGDMSRLLTESNKLFAFDTESGQKIWQYDAEHSIRHNTIAIGGGKVLLIDRPMAEFDRVKKPKTKEHALGTLIAINIETGKIEWQKEGDIFGTMLAIQEDHDAILMSYQYTRFRLDSEFGGRLAAYRLSTGERIWNINAKYASRPMINGRTIYVQGGAWDLLTGEAVPFDFKRSYGCGILASSKHMLVYRSATLGYFDLSGEKKTVNYGGIRPACWINTLPVGGIVLLPDATAGCECSYLNKAWIGLEPKKVHSVQ